MAMPLVRPDALPENTDYFFQYDGCDESDTCLKCPLHKCKYEMTQAERGEWEKGTRPQQVAELIADGWTHREVAEHLGISLRTVYRDNQNVRRSDD